MMRMYVAVSIAWLLCVVTAAAAFTYASSRLTVYARRRVENIKDRVGY